MAGTHHRGGRTCRPGFSLLELAIVVVILTVVSAVAIPRMMRGADHADVETLRRNYQILNKALGFYAAEHGGTYPVLARIENQLTMCSDLEGTAFSRVPDEAAGIVHGPYLLSIPVVTWGPHAGQRKIGSRNGEDIGWLYDEQRHVILPNLLDNENNLPGDFEERGWIDRGEFDGLRSIGPPF